MPVKKKKSTGKPAVKPRGRKRAERNFNAALWSVPMAVQWSGLIHHRLLELIHAGEIKAIAMGPGWSHVRRDGRAGRRSCAKYLVVAKSLMAFVEKLGTRGKLLRSALALKYHPDVGGSTDTMQRLNRLMERLRQGGLAA